MGFYQGDLVIIKNRELRNGLVSTKKEFGVVLASDDENAYCLLSFLSRGCRADSSFFGYIDSDVIGEYEKDPSTREKSIFIKKIHEVPLQNLVSRNQKLFEHDLRVLTSKAINFQFMEFDRIEESAYKAMNIMCKSDELTAVRLGRSMVKLYSKYRK